MFESSNIDQEFEFSLEKFQIDNQLPTSLYPILIEQKPLSDPKPVLKASFVRSLIYGDELDYYKYASFLLQELIIKVDDGFVYKLLDFIDSLKFDQFGQPKIFESQSLVKGKDVFSLIKSQSSNGKESSLVKRQYFELLHLNPVKFEITFEMQSKTESSNFLHNFLRILGTSFISIQETNIKLNALVLRHVFGRQDKIVNRIQKHYTRSFMKQLYKIIGSIDILGDPVGLLGGIGTGVIEFFHEPAKGIVHSPGDFAIGIGKGSWSLVKNSISGVMGTASKVIGAVGKGFTALTLDDEYKEQRRRDKLKNKPKHAGDGVVKGGKAFAKSLWSGVSGIVTQPIKGAKKEGVKGFFKGAGKGLVGVVSKPVVGVTEFSSNVFDGIKNTTKLFDPKSLGKARSPRYIGQDRILTIFNPDKSSQQLLLTNLSNGAYRKELCIEFRVCIERMKSYIILTEKRMIYFVKEDVRLDFLLTQILENKINGNFLELTYDLGSTKKKTKKMKFQFENLEDAKAIQEELINQISNLEN
eukprot:Anaeramoba_ignava/a218061_314.p1 GENE.a218061_314~~a218061_314.p1  ORF type:complete len:527 (+),score=169.74 a218061_314:330-1910(+)